VRGASDGGDERAEALLGRRRRAEGLRERHDDSVEDPRDDRGGELFLAADVVLEHRLVEARARRDLVDAGLAEPLLREDPRHG
jgi:hypothetical protein